ncbi:hypothetical protein Dsin_021066 [Dipteronia sinensis]|uniref:V-type proton ATPase subunit C n=1 Tax=Dipteronia sinensis TaxID=43782 RepID=A0AAE0AAP1_9ROSI|nr:hypothetical protein Dsin_021066 [Dipteronia sinensis]
MCSQIALLRESLTRSDDRLRILRGFVWDDPKYPAMSTLREIVDDIHTQVLEIEDDLKDQVNYWEGAWELIKEFKDSGSTRQQVT